MGANPEPTPNERNMSLDLIEHLKQMLSAPGLSGYEDPVREIIAEAWKPYTDEITVSNLGSLHGLAKGSALSRAQG